MKGKLNIRYMVELAVTLVLLLVITVVLVRMFVLSRDQSIHARELTEAVSISQSIAEISGVSRTIEEFTDRLEGRNEISKIETNGKRVLFIYTWNDAHEAEEGNQPYSYEVQVIRDEDTTDAGTLVSSDIDVYRDPHTSDVPVYSLEASSYISRDTKEAGR